MIVVVILCILLFALSCFAIGFIVSDNMNEKRYWKRQNDMSRLNKWL